GVEVHEVAPGRPNVVAWLGDKEGGRSLLLEGHTDVVTEGDPREWTHAPFGAEVVDGKIYGRGAADMKGGLAAAMIAGAATKKATCSGRTTSARRPSAVSSPRRSSASQSRTRSASSSVASSGRASW